MRKPTKAPAKHESESPPRTADELIAKAKRMSAQSAKQEGQSSQSAKELLAKFRAQQNPKKSTSKRGD